MDALLKLAETLRKSSEQLCGSGTFNDGAAFAYELSADKIEALATTLAAREDGWRPIESAPKDGTEVFIRLDTGEVVRAAWAYVETDEFDMDVYEWQTTRMAYIDMSMVDDDWTWQPLPAAPPAQGTGEPK